MEDAQTLKGITIVAQSETPGLGSKIIESSFVSEFVGVNIDDIFLKKDGGQIDAITGASISSEAVVDVVRNTAMEKVKSLKERE